MKFDIFFIIKGPADTIVVPNNTNPVECANLASLLAKLADNLPSMGVETVGTIIKEAGKWIDLSRIKEL